MDFPRQSRLNFFTLFSFSLIQVCIWIDLWREQIVFRKCSMAFPFYLIKYHLWGSAALFVYSRFRGNWYISDVPKAPPTGREWMCIFNNPVCSAKIHPHKLILNNIIIYTSDSSLILKIGLKVQRLSFLYLLYTLYLLTKTCIAWMHCKSLWIKASAKCININVIIYLVFCLNGKSIAILWFTTWKNKSVC